ncbi:tetratricopeptide repeat protein [Amycolatopsis japonica]
MVNIAHAHRDMANLETAMHGYRSARELCGNLGDRYHEALALLGIAELHRRTSEYDAAREHAQRALGIFVDLGGEEADVGRKLLASLGTEATS